MDKRIISIGDFSGQWSQPWRDAGYTTVRIDPKLSASSRLSANDVPVGMTAQQYAYEAALLGLPRTEQHGPGRVQGCLFAPPCTDFASSGARWWPEKDTDGRTEAALEIVDACLRIVELFEPEWWLFENPVGRLRRLRPQLGDPMYVHPHDFAHLADDPSAEAYTKKTGLWGVYDRDALKAQMGTTEPVMITGKDGKRGSWMWAKLGGKSERTKTLRSMTPQGLARATFNATQGRIGA